MDIDPIFDVDHENPFLVVMCSIFGNSDQVITLDESHPFESSTSVPGTGDVVPI